MVSLLASGSFYKVSLHLSKRSTNYSCFFNQVELPALTLQYMIPDTQNGVSKTSPRLMCNFKNPYLYSPHIINNPYLK